MMNKLKKCAMALGLTLVTGATMAVTAPSAGAETFRCYTVDRDASIYEYASTTNKQGSIAAGRLLRGVRDNHADGYSPVQWWKSGQGDTTWESLWTVSSATDIDYVSAVALTEITC